MCRMVIYTIIVINHQHQSDEFAIKTRYEVLYILSTYQISKELVLIFVCNVIFYNIVLSPADLVT